MNIKTVVLFRPTGPIELKLVEESGFSKWPPRLPEQPIFYPEKIAKGWNVQDSGLGYATKFYVKETFIQKYEI